MRNETLTAIEQAISRGERAARLLENHIAALNSIRAEAEHQANCAHITAECLNSSVRAMKDASEMFVAFQPDPRPAPAPVKNYAEANPTEDDVRVFKAIEESLGHGCVLLIPHEDEIPGPMTAAIVLRPVFRDKPGLERFRESQPVSVDLARRFIAHSCSRIRQMEKMPLGNMLGWQQAGLPGDFFEVWSLAQ